MKFKILLRKTPKPQSLKKRLIRCANLFIIIYYNCAFYIWSIYTNQSNPRILFCRTWDTNQNFQINKINPKLFCEAIMTNSERRRGTHVEAIRAKMWCYFDIWWSFAKKFLGWKSMEVEIFSGGLKISPKRIFSQKVINKINHSRGRETR